MKVENLFNNSFKLNGKSFNSDVELLEFSKSISIEVFDFFNSWFNESSYVMVQTSGSTGEPKVIQLQKKHMVNSAKATGSFFKLIGKTTALLCMSPNFIAGKMMLVRALTLGWDIYIVEPVSNPLKKTKKKYDFVAMVPLQLNNSLTEIGSVKKLIVGGGVVSKELLCKIQNVKTEIFATYGMTETITHIAIKKLNCYSKRREESYYKTLPNISISKDNRDCLVIDAPNISDERVVTNDIVEVISKTEFEWIGRYDSIINSGGIKLIPEQIEEKISKVILNRFFVGGIQDEILGEKLILIVEGEKGTVTLNALKDLTSLSKYEMPKEIYFLNQFIETPTKKINRDKTLSLLGLSK